MLYNIIYIFYILLPFIGCYQVSWMASPTQWIWVWVNFGSWWWTGTAVHEVAKSLTWLSNWTELNQDERASLSYHQCTSSAGFTGDEGSIPGLWRSAREGNGNPLQYCCLGNPMDRGAWRATVCAVTELDTTTKIQQPRIKRPCEAPPSFRLTLSSKIIAQRTF